MGELYKSVDAEGKVKVYDLPPEKVQDAIDAGLERATQADAAAAIKRAEAGSVAGQARAFTESFAANTIDAATAIPRTATALGSHVAGVADPLADMTGRGALETGAYALGGGGLQGARAANEYAENARLAAEENKGSATFGAIGGQILGAELGGLGALARGAGGLATKAAGAGRMARIGGAGLAGAAEGAPLALTAAQDEAYIQNRKLTGEMALAAMGTGALIGGGLGIAAKGLGEAIGARRASRAAAADVEAVAQQQFGEAAPGLRDAYANAAGAVSGKDPATIRSLVAGGEQGAAARRIAVFEGDSIREASKRAIRDHVDDMSGATRNLTEEWRGSLKSDNVGKVISRGESSAAQIAQVDGQLAAVKTKLSEMLDDGAAYGERAKLQKLGRFVETAEKEYGRALETGSNEGMFVAMDELKKKVGALANPGRMITSSADQAVAQEARVLHDSLRNALQDEAVWGGAAAMQKEVNEPFTRWMKSKNLFDRRFMTETGDVAANPWEKTFGADPSKINGYVEGLTSAKNDLDHQLIRKHIANTKDLASSLAKAGELTPEKAAELSKVVKAAEGFEGTVSKAESSLVLSNQLRELEKMGAGSTGQLLGAAGGAVLGGAFSDDNRGAGAGVGATLGAVLGGLRNPALMVRRMAMIERMADKAGVSIDGSLGKLFNGIEGTVGKVKQAANTARVAATPTALEMFQGKHATPELAYKERAKEVLAANANYGQQIRDNAGQVFGSSFDSDPHAVGAAVVATTKAVQYLAEKMPQGLVNPQSLTPMSSKTSPSRADIMQYAQIHTAVTQPLAVIGDISKGTVTRAQIEAIAYVHPALLQHVRTQTLERLQKLDQKGIEVPIRQRLILDSLLDLDGAGERTFSTTFAIKYQGAMSDTAAVQAQGPRPEPRVSKSTERLATETDQMIGGT